MSLDKIICIAGPTATGKTELAVALALALDGEVVSCDSMQVYRRMDIGTAKPTAAERRGVPHHMLDVAEPDEPMSVGKFTALAGPVVEDILARGKTAVLAGGTGLYLDALVRGNAFPPVPATGRRQELQARAQAEGVQPLYQQLQGIDPAAAARISPGDEKRIIRALEVYLETGRTITDHNLATQAAPPRFHPIWLGLDFQDRAVLYRRIDLRVEQMLERGLLGELKGLLDAGVPSNATALQAIGYKELLAVLTQGADLKEATARIQQASRRYAKRQRTWFRRNPEMHWILRREEEDFSSVFAQAAAHIPFFDNGR